MALRKWSQVEELFAPTSTTKICVIDGADPVNYVISVLDLIQGITTNITKQEIENILTGNITSHTHNQYLTAVTKEMIEAVLTGTILSHTHTVESIIGAVSNTDFQNHLLDGTHLTEIQKQALDTLISGGYGLTQQQIDILNLLSIVNGDLTVSTNLVVEGNITAYGIGNGELLNYQMLSNWAEYNEGMTTWVVSAPLLYGLYTDIQAIWLELETKVPKTTQVLPGIGISGGGALSSDITVSLNIEGLEINSVSDSDYIPFYKPDIGQYRGLVSEFPFVLKTLSIYTPLFTDPNSITGGGLRGGGNLYQDLYLELDIFSLDTYSGDLDKDADYLAIYDASTQKTKKILVKDLPYATALQWGEISGDITNQTDLWTILQGKTSNTVSIIAGEGLYGGGTLTEDRTIELNIGGLIQSPILLTDYVPYYRSGGWQYRAQLQDIIPLIAVNQAWNFQSKNISGTQIGIQNIPVYGTATIKEGENVTITQEGNEITIAVQGIQNLSGIQGSQGIQGIQGPGYIGEDGAQGIQGPAGPAGTSVTIKGSVETSNDLSNISNPTIGDGYIVNESGHLWVWNGTTWIDVGVIKGPQGTIGMQGVSGSQGIQGTFGLQGYQGLQGFEGLQGNQGTQGNPGTQGNQGTQGYIGGQGIQGIQGIQGYLGVQGTQGTQGTQGLLGSQGFQGLQGNQGLHGNQGTQGIQGIQGLQGFQGIIGTGTQGTQGFTGSTVGVSPNTITSSSSNSNNGSTHTHALDATGVTSGSYAKANITVDTKGRITFASNGSPVLEFIVTTEAEFYTAFTNAKSATLSTSHIYIAAADVDGTKPITFNTTRYYDNTSGKRIRIIGLAAKYIGYAAGHFNTNNQVVGFSGVEFVDILFYNASTNSVPYFYALGGYAITLTNCSFTTQPTVGEADRINIIADNRGGVYPVQNNTCSIVINGLSYMNADPAVNNNDATLLKPFTIHNLNCSPTNFYVSIRQVSSSLLFSKFTKVSLTSGSSVNTNYKVSGDDSWYYDPVPVPGSNYIASTAKILKEGSWDTYYAPNVASETPVSYLGLNSSNKVVKASGDSLWSLGSGYIYRNGNVTVGKTTAPPGISKMLLSGTLSMEGDIAVALNTYYDNGWKNINSGYSAIMYNPTNSGELTFFLGNANLPAGSSVNHNYVRFICSTGNIIANNFVLSSSKEIKDNISDIQDTEKFDNIKLIQYQYKNDPTDRTRYGVIAEEVMEINPELVYKEGDTLVVGYIDLLIGKIARLEERIKILEDKLNG